MTLKFKDLKKKYLSYFFSGFLLGYCLESFMESPEEPSQSVAGFGPSASRIVSCYDGDTCRVQTPGGLNFNVRLFGIQAPELPNEKGAQKAKRAINKLLKGKEVSVEQLDRDRYNRPVVEIKLEDLNINKEMLRLGLAKRYTGYTKRKDRLYSLYPRRKMR